MEDVLKSVNSFEESLRIGEPVLKKAEIGETKDKANGV